MLRTEQRRSQDFRPRGATKNVEGANFCGHDGTRYYNKQIPFFVTTERKCANFVHLFFY